MARKFDICLNSLCKNVHASKMKNENQTFDLCPVGHQSLLLTGIQGKYFKFALKVQRNIISE